MSVQMCACLLCVYILRINKYIYTYKIQSFPKTKKCNASDAWSPASLETHYFALCKPTRIRTQFAANLPCPLYVCSTALVMLNVFSTDYFTPAFHTEVCSVLSVLLPV